MTDSIDISSAIEGLRQRVESLETPSIPSTPLPTFAPKSVSTPNGGDFFRMDNMTMWISVGAFFVVLFALWHFTRKEEKKEEKKEKEAYDTEEDDDDEDSDDAEEFQDGRQTTVRQHAQRYVRS